jgi:transcriptional regulator with XRE-family HTH domain
MGRKKRPAMAGLGELGARLRQLRQRAGISQMKLARAIGFDPAHGYKYILRLEKGSVPNPTLRTVAAIIEACGATWPDVADVLPATGTGDAQLHARASAVEREPESRAPESEPAPAGRQPSPDAPARRKDSRPMREQLRSRRIEERSLRTQLFWKRVKQAEEAARALLRDLHTPAPRQEAYLAFCRACCSTLDALATARPEVVGKELGRAAQAATQQGLDRSILARIQSVCTRTFQSDTPAA